MHIIKITLRTSRVVWFSGFVEQVSPTQIKVHVALTDTRDFATCFGNRQMAVDIAKAITHHESFAMLQTEEA